METNYFNRSRGACGNGTDHRMLPEAELWTQVILQAINDLDGRTSSIPGSAQDSAREWFASESDAVGSFIWTCQIINVDPNFIRSRLAKKQRMKKSDEVMPYIAQRAKALRRKNPPLSENLDRAQGRPAFKRLAV
jgi:hypothetical protein